jgi:acetyl-CoA carboxylase carboxyltransferase component
MLDWSAIVPLIPLLVAVVGAMVQLVALLSQRRINAATERKARAEMQVHVAEVYEAQARTSQTQSESAKGLIDEWQEIAAERAVRIRQLESENNDLRVQLIIARASLRKESPPDEDVADPPTPSA